ncbi:hypothetical protein AB0F59_26220 [Micromonospora lupini]|uniref:hypothetical protein n=1 Tax=Micromonospora lupini TaxID=285679 RepID=UPI0033E02A34
MPDAELLVLDPGQLDDAAPLGAVVPPDVRATLVDPLDSDLPLPPVARAGAIAARFAGAGSVTVMAHCTNAAVGFEVAAALSRRGATVRSVVVFAPIEVDAPVVAEHAGGLLVALGGSAADAAADWAGDPDGALRKVTRQLRAAALNRAAGLELDPDEAEDFAALLTGRYERWLGHLAAHIGADITAPDCPVHVLDADADAGAAAARRISPRSKPHGWAVRDPLDFTDSALRAHVVRLCAKGEEA